MRKLSPIYLFLAVASSQAASLTAPEKSLDGSFWDNSYQPVGSYQNGFFLFHDPGGVVRIFNGQGQKVLDKKIQAPNIVATRLNDVACSGSGQIAVLISTNLGRAIIWLNQAGEPSTVVRMPGYGASRIVFSKDGSLWAAGRAYDAASNEEPEYDVIRRYDSAGKQIGSYLPRNTYDSKRQSPDSESFLASSGENVVFYSATYGDLAELDESGNVIKRTKYMPASPAEIVGMAFTKSGKVVLTVQHKQPRGPAHELYAYDLKTEKGALLDVAKVFDGEGQSAFAMGGDSDQIVLRRTPWPTYHWVHVE